MQLIPIYKDGKVLKCASSQLPTVLADGWSTEPPKAKVEPKPAPKVEAKPATKTEQKPAPKTETKVSPKTTTKTESVKKGSDNDHSS